MTDIARIAAGLDYRMKDGLMYLRDEPVHPSDISVSRRTLCDLTDLGLAVRIQCRHLAGGGSFSGYAISKTGLAVRDYLKEQAHDRP